MRPSFKYTIKNANKNYYNYNYELEEKFLSEKNEYILIALYHDKFCENTGWGKSRLSCEYMKQFILVLLFINYCVIFHMNNCKPTFALP